MLVSFCINIFLYLLYMIFNFYLAWNIWLNIVILYVGVILYKYFFWLYMIFNFYLAWNIWLYLLYFVKFDIKLLLMLVSLCINIFYICCV
jgi:hypothetical protein